MNNAVEIINKIRERLITELNIEEPENIMMVSLGFLTFFSGEDFVRLANIVKEETEKLDEKICDNDIAEWCGTTMDEVTE